MIYERWVTRWTYWRDERGEVTQVSVAVLEVETWEPQAVVTESVGPFDDVERIAGQALLDAKNLARRQVPGQLGLLDA